MEINELELASKLADQKLMDNLLNGLINDPKDEPVFIEQENGDTRYSEAMQDEFNRLYDFYLTMIEDCKED